MVLATVVCHVEKTADSCEVAGLMHCDFTAPCWCPKTHVFHIFCWLLFSQSALVGGTFALHNDANNRFAKFLGREAEGSWVTRLLRACVCAGATLRDMCRTSDVNYLVTYPGCGASAGQRLVCTRAR